MPKIKKNKIIWMHEDFQGHPDEKCLDGELVQKIWADIPIQKRTRIGVGYVLPDGKWVFPGDQYITWIKTFDSIQEAIEWEKEKE